jgi:16S rRNA (cytidine1402-2'-O)-methyltransferase
VARHRKPIHENASAAIPSAVSSEPSRAERRLGESEDSHSDPKAEERGGKSFRLPHREEQRGPFAPGLYLTATPIGNAADITLRALSILGQCDAIVAEDTRVTARLLAIHGISRKMLAYNDHNAPSMRPKLIRKLKEGARLALVSDAGTPLVSDPGHKLVRAAREAGVPVYPVPGPCAALAALTASGLPSDRFMFVGFLPSKPGARRNELASLRSVLATLIFFESPQRLKDTLADMAELLGAREGAVARELTKLHEEVRVAPLATLAEVYSGEPPKGEITILAGPPPQEAADPVRIDALLVNALAFMPVSAASRLVADATGAARRTVYERALALNSRSGDGRKD